MKKSLFIILLINFLILFHISLNAEEQKLEKEFFLSNRESTYTINIPPNIDNYDKNYSIEIIENILNKHNAGLIKQVVTDKTESVPTVTTYTYLQNPKQFFSNINYTGEMLASYDSSDSILSTFNSNSSGQIGTIQILKNSPVYEIKTFQNIVKDDRILAGYYLITFDNSNTDIDRIVDDLIEELGIRVTLTESFESSGPPINMIMYLTYIPLIFLYLIIFVLVFYMIFFKQQDIAVKKMLGYSDNKISNSFLKNILILGIAAIVLGSIVIFILFNKIWNYLHTSLMLKVILIYLLILILVLIFSFILLRKANSMNIVQQLKREKPIRSFKKISIIAKFLFSIFVTIIAILAINDYQYATAFYKENIQAWEESKYYASVPLKYMDMDNHNNIERFIWEIKQQRELTAYIDELGSIRIWIPHEIKYPEIGERMKILNGEGSLTGNYYGLLLENNYIQINANYLLKHPIYDLEGNQIIINDEKNAIYFLIPEKKKPVAEDIIAAMKLFYNNDFIMNGPQLHEYLPDLYDAEEPEYIPIFTEDNQEYFTYDYNAFIENYNRMVDPVAVVYTLKTSFTGDISLNTGYYIKINDPHNPFAAIENKVKELGLGAYYDEAYSAYDIVSKMVYEHQQTLAVEIASITVLGIMIVLLSLYTTTIYLDERKLKNTVEIFNGYSYMKRHMKHIVYLLLFHLILMIAMIVLFFATSRILLIIAVSIMLLLIDLVVFIILSIIGERKNIRRILNGE